MHRSKTLDVVICLAMAFMIYVIFNPPTYVVRRQEKAKAEEKARQVLFADVMKKIKDSPTQSKCGEGLIQVVKRSISTQTINGPDLVFFAGQELTPATAKKLLVWADKSGHVEIFLHPEGGGSSSSPADFQSLWRSDKDCSVVEISGPITR